MKNKIYEPYDEKELTTCIANGTWYSFSFETADCMALNITDYRLLNTGLSYDLTELDQLACPPAASQQVHTLYNIRSLGVERLLLQYDLGTDEIIGNWRPPVS